jgi:hypothetical protein
MLSASPSLLTSHVSYTGIKVYKDIHTETATFTWSIFSNQFYPILSLQAFLSQQLDTLANSFYVFDLAVLGFKLRGLHPEPLH